MIVFSAYCIAAHVELRTARGLSKKEIIRCLKRYVAREVCPQLRPGS
jgi:hypothetical protein